MEGRSGAALNIDEAAPEDYVRGLPVFEVRGVLDGTFLAAPTGRLTDAGRMMIEAAADSAADTYVSDKDGGDRPRGRRGNQAQSERNQALKPVRSKDRLHLSDMQNPVDAG